MKIELKDADSNKFEIGYDTFDDNDGTGPKTLFWIETEWETVTMNMSTRQMDRLASAIQFIKANI